MLQDQIWAILFSPLRPKIPHKQKFLQYFAICTCSVVVFFFHNKKRKTVQKNFKLLSIADQLLKVGAKSEFLLKMFLFEQQNK